MTPGEMMAERKRILYRWMMKAFDAGQKLDKFSDQRSEFYAPMIDMDWVPKMIEELAAAAASGEYTEVVTERLKPPEVCDFCPANISCMVDREFGVTDDEEACRRSYIADLQAKDGGEDEAE